MFFSSFINSPRTCSFNLNLSSHAEPLLRLPPSTTAKIFPSSLSPLILPSLIQHWPLSSPSRQLLLLYSTNNTLLHNEVPYRHLRTRYWKCCCICPYRFKLEEVCGKKILCAMWSFHWQMRYHQCVGLAMKYAMYYLYCLYTVLSACVDTPSVGTEEPICKTRTIHRRWRSRQSTIG